MRKPMVLMLIVGIVIFASAHARAQGNGNSPNVAQVVALDECDPTTFNAAAGPDFCKNVALAAFGYATTLVALLAGAEAVPPDPDPGWDFEPDLLTIKQGTT